MTAPSGISDEAKRLAREMAVAIVTSCAPLFVAWGLEVIKAKLADRKRGPEQ